MPIDQKTKDKALLQIVYLFILPVLLIYFNIIPAQFRVQLLAIVALVTVFIMIREKWDTVKIGLFKRYSIGTIILYSLFTVIGLWWLLHFAREFGFHPENNWWRNERFLLLFIPLSILQEVLYRMFLIPKLKELFETRMTVVLVNAALFTLLHIIYPEPALMLPLAFAGGLGFAALYLYRPNIVLISITHIILNFVAVLLGFFTFAS
jgi:membrane protease YdiL (CAAX protease family)